MKAGNVPPRPQNQLLLLNLQVTDGCSPLTTLDTVDERPLLNPHRAGNSPILQFSGVCLLSRCLGKKNRPATTIYRVTLQSISQSALPFLSLLQGERCRSAGFKSCMWQTAASSRYQVRTSLHNLVRMKDSSSCCPELGRDHRRRSERVECSPRGFGK